MTPQYMQVRHNPDSDQYGDCARASIATLLDTPLDDVPHFAEDGPDAETFHERIQDYLRGRGYYMAGIYYGGNNITPLQVGEVMKEMNPDLYYLMGVRSPEAEHFIVCCGSEIVCEPGRRDFTLGDFTVGPDNMVWVFLLVPLSQVRS